MPLDSDLVDRSLALSEAERADLAHRLLPSLEASAPASSEVVDEAWAAELQRRVDQVDRGEVKMIPWPEAEKRIRESLHKARRP
ncbi:MAG: addiction module protein [Tepidisphaeraceae bacterium]|jgi:putative addiction module component (TIGR02574 family)